MFNIKFSEKKYKKIHFIGIGGVSMSGLALLMQHNGFTITGSDITDSTTLEQLRNANIKVFIGQKKENITDQDLFVYTDAIPETSEELIAARATGKDVVSRGVFLGGLMKNYKTNIAVSGSHGKSTTTSMIAKILMDCKTDASILLGGLFDEINGNVRIGNSDILLTEACEFKGNILNYYPSTVIILNIDEDHLDYYKDLNHIVETFIGYMKNIGKDDKAIINIDDKNTNRLLEYIQGEIITFGLNNKNADYHITDIKFDDFGDSTFKLKFKDGSIHEFNLNIAGEHNVYNAIAAIIASYENDLDIKIIKESIKNYKSLHRRMETIGFYNGAKIITDYAHHPVEIKSTLKTVLTYTNKNIIAIFQPHTYSRTKSLLNEFAKSFDGTKEVIITDIYAAREPLDPTIHSKDLVNKLIENGVNAKYISDFESTKKYLQAKITEDDIVLAIGPGDPHILAEMIVNE